MKSLTLHLTSRGYLVDNYPVRIGWTQSGGWRISALDPSRMRITQWIKRNRFDKQLFQTRQDACLAASLALTLNPPMERPRDAKCVYIKAGHWKLENGLEAKKHPKHRHWLIYKDGKVIQYTMTLWRAARMAADKGAAICYGHTE